MGNELAGLIKADLAALTNDAQGLAALQVAPAAQLHGEAPSGMSFAQSLKDAVGKVDNDDRLAAERMADVDSGKSGDLVGAMLASQEASLSFSMLMQVRNKVMGAVDELIKLPL
ncbi:flagellar hook-basal body complex protein FliE [Janthinobacterium fluminis]|uniref:Flagellar hook-basal body complex protein FliE n=1 Tax=Janthinobacterium fluminis TaxID=2987524 RepID=A0ABT5JUS5_9BURK|nr:flagellar hook-basal body complex protein FliE [Janthinobacterium fluminis]MDC8756502.1 flagellar hook-basal body complex protein FliE [Janthinobacterium fluminis]